MFGDNLPPKYPWAALYDLESGIAQPPQIPPEAAPGRPAKTYKRNRTSVTLTDEEKRLYEKITYVLGDRLHPNKVTKGQVLGLTLRLLDSQIPGLPTTLQSWEDLAGLFFPDANHDWAKLYDLESGVTKLPQARPGAAPGRPPKPFKRLHTSVTFTDEEKRIYDRITYVMGGKLHPNKVTKGQIMGLSLRLLDSRLEAVPDSLHSWEDLAELVFDQRGRKRR